MLPTAVIWISIPPGILTFLLLLINEFPDVEADRAGGRRHLVIVFGVRGASYVYASGIALTFLFVAAAPILGFSQYWLYLALIPLPLGIKAAVGAVEYGSAENREINRLIPALGSNVITVLATDLLLAVGVVIQAN